MKISQQTELGEPQLGEMDSNPGPYSYVPTKGELTQSKWKAYLVLRRSRLRES